MIACPHCGFSNIEGRTICKSCGKDMRVQAAPVSATLLELPLRTAILDEEIARQVGAGWRLQVRTETTAQLVREASDVNGCVAILLFLLAIVPGLLYMMLAKKTESMFVQIDQYGRILRTIGGGVQTQPISTSPTVEASTGSTIQLGSSKPSLTDRLRILEVMRTNGSLTEEEYLERRQKLLDV